MKTQAIDINKDPRCNRTIYHDKVSSRNLGLNVTIALVGPRIVDCVTPAWERLAPALGKAGSTPHHAH